MTDIGVSTGTAFTPPLERPPAVPQLDYADIQGNLLRGYRAARSRHFMLAIGNAEAASRFIETIIPGGTARNRGLAVTTEEPWSERPAYFLNLGVTSAGLRALGVPDVIVAAFPTAFRDGPTRRESQGSAPATRVVDMAKMLGDTGASDPSGWVYGRPGGDPVHLVVSLYCGKAEKRDGSGATLAEEHDRIMDSATVLLRDSFRTHRLVETHVCDAATLGGPFVHFGYRDGISQPRIKGALISQPADMQDPVETGDFLLGCDYGNHMGGNFRGEIPPELANNGTYGALRMMRQDVAAFDDLLDRMAAQIGSTRDVASSKLLGRWANGKPLSLAPTDPNAAVPDADINNFAFDDSDGAKCPVGSHIRRLNPRGSTVMGNHAGHRLVRRGMPYGPPFQRGKPDAAERGLIGYFLCGDLEMQFEFLLWAWANGDYSRAGLRGTLDPLIGNPTADRNGFVIPMQQGPPVVIEQMPRLVTTRGTLYAFLPGIGGLRYLAKRGWTQ